MLLLQNYSLRNFNTFGVDAKAKLFLEVHSEDELIEIIINKNYQHEKMFILGGGSNILFTKDYDGIIIKISIKGINVIEEEENSVIIESGAGIIWNDLVKFCVDNNYGGIENLTLIPGTVGAAPVQNIGAYGQEIADTFISLDGVSINTGKKKTFTKKDSRFSYRSSIFKEELKNEFVITSVRLKLSKVPKPNLNYKALNDYLSKKEITNPSIKDISNAVAEIRRSKLPDPLKIGNAGSFFKNPVVMEDLFQKIKSDYPDIASFPSESGKTKIFAGWLIEKSGWKGKRVGDVGTSPEHALVICNFGKATGAEILEFAMRIKEEVSNKFGIILEEEVNIL
jgi:UDP-N-acetylmuramate dehydrogenase